MNNDVWQKCPVCNGDGNIPSYGTSTSLFLRCPTCDGERIISRLTGYQRGAFEGRMTEATEFFIWLVRVAKIEVIDARMAIEARGFSDGTFVPVMTIEELYQKFKSETIVVSNGTSDPGPESNRTEI